MQRRWNELTRAQRTTIALMGAVEVMLTAVAAADLSRRSQAAVRGPKALWWPALAVQPFGPIAYLGWGRRPPAGQAVDSGGPTRTCSPAATGSR